MNPIKLLLRRANPNKVTPEKIKRIMRRVFLSADGQEVLRKLLTDWSYFDICTTKKQRVLNDYAKLFLHDLFGEAQINVIAEIDESAIEEH
jgi:hypothetical protein